VPANSVTLDPNASTVSLNIKRGAGDGNVVGVMVGLQGPDGTIRSFRQNLSISELEMKNYQVNYSGSDLSDIVKITVTPIFRDMTTGQEQLGLPTSQPVSYHLPSGLVANWHFDGDWVDSVNGLNGVSNIVGGAGAVNLDFNNKKFGSASANFPGSISSYININHDTILDSNSFTLIAWVDESSGGNFRDIFDKDTTVSGTDGFFLYYYTIGNIWRFRMLDSSGANSPSVTLSELSGNVIGKWKFVSISYESSSQTMTICSDSSCNSAYTSSGYHHNSLPLKIGSYWQGNIDNLLFFNRALSLSEIQSIRTKYTGN
jgi:hypothetical protein